MRRNSQPPAVGPSVGPVGLIGAAAAIFGSFLPWATALGSSVTAWQLTVNRLVSRTESGVPIGPFLLVAAVVLLPLFTRKQLPAIASLVAAALIVNLAGMALVLTLKSGPGVVPGIGSVITLVGGLLVAIGSTRLQFPGEATR